jgi:predicted helicase
LLHIVNRNLYSLEFGDLLPHEPMERLKLKITHKPVRTYYEQLRQYEAIGVSHEGAVRAAFQNLLESCGSEFGWKLISEWPIKRPGRYSLRVDGALVDEFRLTHGFWEAKDSKDDLPREVKKKITLGYPQKNIIFQAPERAILWQDGRRVLDADITQPDALVEILRRFFEYAPPEYEEWDEAVAHFQKQVPELGRALADIIRREEESNDRFRVAFDDFFEVCRQSINPNLSREAVEEMLIQHLLTERIFRTVFNNPDFTRRNVIASEIEKVIDALTSQAFSREAFLQSLDRFYKAIDGAARTIEEFSQKQVFLNTVYEKFFQGFSVKVADTHGIVYTPPPIVSFMVRSVQAILQNEFGKSLGSDNVHILDPFVGTGNFIVHIMEQIQKTKLAQKYKSELHCNEVMLLPYYIASMNIEHEYFESIGSYEPFDGICLVDTFELAESKQISFFTTENAARVERQKASPIMVVIGNPPYNAWQVNENDNNKNRKYKAVDRRVKETYAKESKAKLKISLNDPFVKAIRWASDRIIQNGEGIVAYVTNNSFVDNFAFDGVRKLLKQEFDTVYVLDLGGNVRKNPKLSGTIHNVFGIQVGVSISFLVKRRNNGANSGRIVYASAGEYWRKEEKYQFLDKAQQINGIEWREIIPDENNNWLTENLNANFQRLLPLGNRLTKAAKSVDVEAVFKTYSRGILTCRDKWVFNFGRNELAINVQKTIDAYNEQVLKWAHRRDKRKTVDDFVSYDDKNISWSGDLKEHLQNGILLEFSDAKIRRALYRPFTESFLYFDEHLNNSRYLLPYIFPTLRSELENEMICVAGVGDRKGFGCLISRRITSLDLAFEKIQCFPLYIYDDDGSKRRENVSDWALDQFRSHYSDDSISKRDIFYYVYAVLHHPVYRERYAGDLKRQLPRIPYLANFFDIVRIGSRLADIHGNYNNQPQFPLIKRESSDKALDWRVEKMRLSKDKRSLTYNDFLTLDGIPPGVFDYRLGNRSALERVIDQYQISTDKRSGITNDPNRADDPEYIMKLIGQVITISLETVELVNTLSMTFTDD